MCVSDTTEASGVECCVLMIVLTYSGVIVRVQRCSFSLRALTMNIAHIWTLTVHCTYCNGEISTLSSRNCSQLYSDFKALCEACRHSKVQVRSADSSDLMFFTLSFCLESILKMFTLYVRSSSLFFLSILLSTHNHMHTRHIWEINYGLLKLATLSHFCLALLIIIFACILDTLTSLYL